MEDKYNNNNNKGWFTNPTEQGFSEIYGMGNSTSTLTTNAENTSDNLNNEEENNKLNNKIFLNKKRKKPDNTNTKDYISEIKRLMKEGGLEKDYLFIKKKKKKDNIFNNTDNNINFINNNSNNQKKEEIKPVKPLQQLKSLNEWYQKLNLLPFNNTYVNFPFTYDDKNEVGIVKYYGANNMLCENSNTNTNNNNNNYSKYYIYLREKNDFEFSINNKKNYEWKVTILCDSYLIGIGLADKYRVIKNNHLFLNDDEQFNNGVFCLLNTYNKEFNIKEMRPWNCDDKNFSNLVANFPYFKKGRIINLIYNSNYKTLEFNSKKIKYVMNNVFPKGSNEKKILTPCVVFYYSGNEVQFSKLNIVDMND